MHFQLVTCFCVRLAIGIEVTNPHHVLECLRAHCSCVHSQAATDCPWNSFHPLQPANTSSLRCVRNFSSPRTDTFTAFAAIAFDFVEIATAPLNHHTTDTATAH